MILTAAYHVLDQGVPYNELGEDFFYRRDTENTERYRRRPVKQLGRLGHQVTLEPLPGPATATRYRHPKRPRRLRPQGCRSPHGYLDSA